MNIRVSEKLFCDASGVGCSLILTYQEVTLFDLVKTYNSVLGYFCFVWLLIFQLYRRTDLFEMENQTFPLYEI